MSLIRLCFNYHSILLPPPSTHPHPEHQNEKEGPSLYVREPPGRNLASILFLSSPLARYYTQTMLTCTRERGKENHSATSVLPFRSTVMNRELCKRWSNLRTRKLDGQSRSPSPVCLKTAYRAYQINSYQEGQHPCFFNSHSSRN